MTGGSRRIDRILDPAFLEGLDELPLDELRGRRDECMAEREYLSLVRRLVQGRVEILRAEVESRGAPGELAPVVERLSEILGSDDASGASPRGEAVRVGVPEDEMLLARRRIERLVADADVSDPTALDDQSLAAAVEAFDHEERHVSKARREVIGVLDRIQDELKRRYKQDPTLALN